VNQLEKRVAGSYYFIASIVNSHCKIANQSVSWLHIIG